MELIVLLTLITTRITSPEKGTHPFYKRVNKFAKLYEQLITGEGQEELIKRFFNKETEDEIRKIVNLTQPITSSVSNSLIAAYKKVLRASPIVKKIDFAKDTDTKLPVVEKALANYYSGSSLDYYIDKRFQDLSFIDPNAFIVTEFLPFDHVREKASPYPFEVTSEEAINFGLKNGVLQFLLVENAIKFINEKGEQADGVKLFLYLADHAITFTQVARGKTELKDDQPEYIKQPVELEYRNGDKFEKRTEDLPIAYITKEKQFAIEYFTHKQGRVPAERVGYVPDKKTRGLTFVNPIHYGALPYLMKSVKSVSELDLTMHYHTFPQKIAYGEGCNLDANGICPTSGERIDACKKCGGTGKFGHSSSKDVLEFKLPRTREEMIPLNELIHYAYPPIEGIKFQDEYIDKLKESCYKAVFNSEVFSKDQVEKTATGTNLDMQNAYDVLTDYGNKVSDYWKKSVIMVGVLLDYADIIVEHKFPKDWKLKTVTDLLADLKTANDSGAPAFIITELNRDIARQMYLDRPLELLKYEVRQKLAPFSGKTKDEILMGINAGWSLKRDAVLWMYLEQFFEELEEESLRESNNFEALIDSVLEVADATKVKSQLAEAKKKKLLWFYDLPYAIQHTLLQAKAIEKQEEIEAETSTAKPFGAGAEGGGGTDLGKLPLALQQLGLARQRAVDVGDTALAESLGNTMDELTKKINAQ